MMMAPLSVCSNRSIWPDMMRPSTIRVRTGTSADTTVDGQRLLIQPQRATTKVRISSQSAQPSTRYRLSSALIRSEEHTSELQSLMRISYAVLCLQKKKIYHHYVIRPY